MTKEQVKELIKAVVSIQQVVESDLHASMLEVFNETLDEIEVGYLKLEPDSDYGLNLWEERYTQDEAETCRDFGWLFERFSQIFARKATNLEGLESKF